MRLFRLFLTVTALAAAVFSQTSAPQAYLTEPVLSPDRREIAFVSGGDIWTVAAMGGTAQLLVSHAATEARPLYAPDGKSLAFVSARTGGGDIYVLSFVTGELRRVTFDDAAEQLDAWSRDGQWLYFSSTSRDIAGMSDLFRVRAGGGTPMQVSADRYANEFQSAPAPDGATLAFAARGIANGQWWRKGHSHIDESEIWLWRASGGYEQISPRGAKSLWPMWDADGARLFYVSDRSGAQNLWSQPIKGAAKQLTNFTDGRVLWPNIAYDGKQIVFERNFRLWQLDTATGKAGEIPVTLRGAAAGPLTERVNLSTQIRELALSPDGKKVALVARGEVFAASAKDGGDVARITQTNAPEANVAWSSDSKKLAYVSERGGTAHVYLYDFATESESQLTNAAQPDALPMFSPDGKSLAYVRQGRALFVYDLAAKQEREVCKIYVDLPPLLGDGTVVWSPDSRWLAFLSVTPETRSYTNVHIAPAAGGEAKAVSFLANSNSGGITWSPDGTYLLFDTSQRTEDGQAARVDLLPRTPKFREDQFRDLFKEENPRQRPQPAAAPTPAASPAPEEKKDAPKRTEVVFEGIRQRLSFLRAGLNVGGLAISPDGKTALINASAEGQFNLYTYPLDELAADPVARQITSTAGFKGAAQFTPDGKEVYYLENGRVQIANLERRESRPLNLNVEISVAFAQEKMEVFAQGWRYLRDHFYDDKFHGADWNAVRSTYEPLAAAARNPDELRRLMSLMVGELNASHLGVTGGPTGQQTTPVGKLGLRFDRAEYEQNGRLKITEIIALSPLALAKDVKIGDYLLAVDGVNVTAQTNLDELLENKTGRRVVLSIGDGANKREVVVKPVNTATEKGLLYRQWVEANRAYVAKISGGRLGYVHMPDMSANSLAQLYVDLDADNQARQGVVIDVRNNNGGFVNVYAIDVFARRGYLTMRERGLWNVPGRSALGQRALERPTILITNQHSLSDAEDFTEGYRTLQLGKVVGEPTAGWIIYTWNVGLFDGTTVRLPRQLVTDNRGQNMELNPRPVDLPVTRPLGETMTGKDSQLDKAVSELLGQIGK